jgi:cobalamin biosynthesis Co2+ chelatase CbiK
MNFQEFFIGENAIIKAEEYNEILNEIDNLAKAFYDNK